MFGRLLLDGLWNSACVKTMLLYDSSHFWRTEKVRWVKKNFDEMRNWAVLGWDDNSQAKTYSRWHMRRDEMRRAEMSCDEVRWAEIRWDEMMCECEVEVRSVKFGASRVTCGTARHFRTKARTLGPGWRTAPASSIDGKGLIVLP